MTIRKLLIANRGEIARRVIRAARSMNIATVAVYSDADADAPHVHDADEAIHLPGNVPADTYLRGDLILEGARRLGVDAIHPGYGFLSENAAFARACMASGVVFVGPSPEAIDAMGNKVEAKRRMTAAGVPVLVGVTIDSEMSTESLLAAGAKIGYPILVKAAFGGGGRGMRIVRSPAELTEAVAGAQREAAAAFGDGLVFLERYVEAPRHIEVQVFGDSVGTVVHLFERECSIQRRHQKIIEEAPSTAVTPALRAELGAAAVAAAKAIDYVGAGTVEFVMAPSGEFYFLEVNTRLQVEHPVTELITGLDLVQLQIAIAQGEALPERAMNASINGHAVEARLYAEDVPAGFVPMSGTLQRFDVHGDGVRVDSGYEDGSTVSTFYDAMLAKVIAWAPTRDEAVRKVASALRRAQIHGVVSNRDLLVRTLEHEEFIAGQTDTGFYERHDPAVLGACETGDALLFAHAIAATLAEALARQPSIGAGFRNVAGIAQRSVWECEDRELVVDYVWARDGSFEVSHGGIEVRVEGMLLEAPDVTITIDGIRRSYSVRSYGSVVCVDSALGSCALRAVERFPKPLLQASLGSLRSPLPGSVISVLVAVGDAVMAGDVLVTLEAMKMEHSIKAPHSGTVSDVRVAVGDQVETGAVLVIVD